MLRLWACGQRASVVQAQRHVHSRVGASVADAVAPDGHRRAMAERLMRATGVVKDDPRSDPGARFAAVGVAFEIDVLVLERAPQPLVAYASFEETEAKLFRPRVVLVDRDNRMRFREPI